MIRQLWTPSVLTRVFLRRYMPTNILLGAIYTKRGLKWGIPAMLLAVPYVVAASICTATRTARGEPGWLNLLVILFLWNALKSTITGPISVFYLLKARRKEAAQIRHSFSCTRAA